MAVSVEYTMPGLTDEGLEKKASNVSNGSKEGGRKIKVKSNFLDILVMNSTVCPKSLDVFTQFIQ